MKTIGNINDDIMLYLNVNYILLQFIFEKDIFHFVLVDIDFFNQ